jgi:hypothetical protein
MKHDIFAGRQTVLERRAEDTLRATALESSDVLETKVTEAARDANRPLPALGDLEMSIMFHVANPVAIVLGGTAVPTGFTAGTGSISRLAPTAERS